MPDEDRQRSVREQFRTSRFFPELTGLRAISVLMVLTVHTGDTLWRPVHGYLGVTIFFVISGFLITTLLLREQDRNGSVSLRGFYLRRVFRILPLYYLALAAYSVLVLAGFARNSGDYGHRLVYFLTYLNEFAGSGTFGHSWSLGIEEKFYLLWPLLAFVLPATTRRRPWLAGALLAASAAVGIAAPNGYVGIYVPILAGCCLAVAMRSDRGFRIAAWLAHPVVSALAFVVAVVALMADHFTGYAHVAFGLAVTLTFPTFLIGPRVARRWLTTRPLTFIGDRSYAIYLFHPIVLSMVDLVIPRQGALWAQLARLVLVVAGTLLVADILYRTFERPLIALGRRLATRRPATGYTASVRPVIAPSKEGVTDAI